MLGICVGMQLLCDASEEGGSGLGLIAAPVRRLRARRVPHMGWNALDVTRPSVLLEGLDGEDVYFAHSYAVEPPARDVTAAQVEHDGVVVAAVEQGALAGVQFHPERSGARGRAPLRERGEMVKKRVIPCLDVAGGRVVKGVRFEQLRDVGDPIELATPLLGARSRRAGLSRHHGHAGGSWPDARARRARSRGARDPVHGRWRRLGLADARALLRAGADKVAVNRAAFEDPLMLTALADEFGSQAVVCAIDARGGEVVTHAGRNPRGRGAVAWAEEAVARGAGEILLTSIDADGTRAGYDLRLTTSVSEAVTVPVIASGGAGQASHLAAAFAAGAEAALVASIVHERPERLRELKTELREAGWQVRS